MPLPDLSSVICVRIVNTLRISDNCLVVESAARYADSCRMKVGWWKDCPMKISGA